MMKVYGMGQGGKHRDTAEAAHWRDTVTQIADAIVANWAVGRSIATTYAEDEMARVAYRMNLIGHERTGL